MAEIFNSYEEMANKDLSQIIKKWGVFLQSYEYYC